MESSKLLWKETSIKTAEALVWLSSYNVSVCLIPLSVAGVKGSKYLYKLAAISLPLSDV